MIKHQTKCYCIPRGSEKKLRRTSDGEMKKSVNDQIQIRIMVEAVMVEMEVIHNRTIITIVIHIETLLIIYNTYRQTYANQKTKKLKKKPTKRRRNVRRTMMTIYT
jgi:hypothetical protein